MYRLTIGLVILAIAGGLLGYAGGLDIGSVSDWRQVAQKWTLPAIADNGRCLALLGGGIFVLLAGIRFAAPLQSA